MSTRGAVGFYIDGQSKLTYNHSDSYPSGLGQAVVDFIRRSAYPASPAKTEAGLRDRVRALRVVDPDSTPSQEDIARLEPFAKLSVSTGGLTDWYVLLRGTQGDLGKILEAGVMIDGSGFMQDSLFCEWAYVVNLDTRELEVYRGFQTKKHKRGRYASAPEFVAVRLQGGPTKVDQTTYYAVALTATFGFEALPDKLDAAIITENGRKRKKAKEVA